jgi:hypothetical protein
MASVRRVLAALGETRVSELVVGTRRPWPPPPGLSLRDLIVEVAGPSTPEELWLDWDVDVAGRLIHHGPSDQAVPVDVGIGFNWRDPGASTARQAAAFVVDVTHAAGPVAGSPFTTELPDRLSLSFDRPDRFTWVVRARNDVGESPPTTANTFQTVAKAAPPPPPPPPPPTPAVVTIRLGLDLPANEQSITSAAFQLVGPGAPTTPAVAVIQPDRRSAVATIALPPPAGGGLARYQLTGQCAFHYSGLTGPSGVTGPEDTEAEFAQPVPVSWTGHAMTLLVGLRYELTTNAFSMSVVGQVGP